ncbi:type II toxin-antitoxin system SpoIISA family toxin [Bacillus sp. UNCCL81]|uniref:type II toxin-antitoxin system SpoIISA family toxin n=1 Tax=Bacillus sp. UNCCL81 TaxID=1502755 RepID=UPI0008E10177|nr:type II toxin-antitoxin system SpoIISA family toxin [Bacillus sp. UNCCL81]SFC95569.1 Toxin SpoIISA, type II toxin-antitoxin system [Bacillus sp. UNCCL81]
MKVQIGKYKVNFLVIYVILLVLMFSIIFSLMFLLHVSHLKVLFGGFSILLLIVLAFYWMDSKSFHNNLGRIRRTYYTLYLIVMAIGVITSNLDFKNWKLLTEISALVVFIDLAVFLCPNILKIWSAEFKYEDEVREALTESKQMILKSAKKAENFSKVIQETVVSFDNKPLPQSREEYVNQLSEYLKLYSDTFGIAITIFIFDSPISEEDKQNKIQSQITKMSIRHAINLSTNEEDKKNMIKTFSYGETIILKEEKLISIPYFGNYYSMIVTLEAGDVAVDGIDASYISNLLYIFDWYMVDLEEDDE